MTGYQAGIKKFEGMETQVFGISTDHPATLAHWAKELNAEFPLLSDDMRKTSADYGVLIPANGLANRSSFVIGLDGKIQHIEEGSAAIDPVGVETACKRIKSK
jgi:peroxiredoxin